MKIQKVMLEQIIREEAAKIQKLKVLKEEKDRIVKQLNELYEEDSIDEGKFGDFLSGVSKYKNNWKPAFEYYRKGGKNKLAAFLANVGTQLENSGWQQKGQNYNNFTDLIESYIVALKGRMVPGSMGAGGTSTDAVADDWITTIAKEYEANPTIYDSKIAEFAKLNPREIA